MSGPARRRFAAGALAYWLAVTVVVAALTHLCTILALPYRSPEDAYSRMARLAPGAALTTVAGPAADGSLPGQDPALASAFCLYDLRQGAVQVGLDVADADFAMVSVYGRHGQVLYGLTNRSAAQDHLALTILTARQAEARPKGDNGSAGGKVRVETDETEGVVLAQALATAPSQRGIAESQALRLVCAAEPAQAPAAAATNPSTAVAR